MEVLQGNSSRGKLMAMDTTKKILMASVRRESGNARIMLPKQKKKKEVLIISRCNKKRSFLK